MKRIKKTITLYLVLPDGTKKVDRITINHELTWHEKDRLENGIKKAVLVPIVTYATMLMTAIGLYDLTSIYISTSSYTDDEGNTKVPTGAAVMGLFGYFVGGTFITMAAGDAVGKYVDAFVGHDLKNLPGCAATILDVDSELVDNHRLKCLKRRKYRPISARNKIKNIFSHLKF